MGIKDLMKYIKKKKPNIIKKVDLQKYKNTRVAVDANLWCYTHMSIAQKGVLNKTDLSTSEPDRNEVFKILIQMWLDTYLKWGAEDILLIMCFDGSHPAKKKIAHDKRTEAKNLVKNKITELEEKLAELDILEIQQSDLDELKRAKANLNWVSKEEFSTFKSILKSYNIPYLTATGQGEKLCTTLVIDGICSAALGKDADMLAYGCKSILNNLKLNGYDINGVSNYSIEEINLLEILNTLGFNFSTFVDFCVSLGCDYNSRIKNYGPAKMHKLLTQHGTLERVRDEAKLNIDCLDADFCRTEFKYVNSKSIIAEGTYNLVNCDNVNKINKLDSIYKVDENANLLYQEQEVRFGLTPYVERLQKMHSNIKLNPIVESLNLVGLPKIVFKKN